MNVRVFTRIVDTKLIITLYLTMPVSGGQSGELSTAEPTGIGTPVQAAPAPTSFSFLRWPAASGSGQVTGRMKWASVAGRVCGVRCKLCRLPGISRSDGRGQNLRNTHRYSISLHAPLGLAWVLTWKIHPFKIFGQN